MRWLAGTVFLVACSNLHTRTAKMIGCPADQTEITREWSVLAANEEDSWDAWCHGQSTFKGPGSPDNVNRLFACTKTKDAEKCVEVYPR